MQMRFEGVLSQWDDTRGFGFITPSVGGDTVFVHVSAFPRMGHRPIVGLRVSFEIETRPDGRKRAKQIRLVTPTSPETGQRPTRHLLQHRAGHRRIPVLLLLLGIALVGWAYQRYTTHAPVLSGDDLAPTLQLPTGRKIPAPEPSQVVDRCDGRQYCSQMTSCAEAKFFLQHCPTVQMDGDNDGIPCEQQWCHSSFSN